MSTGEPQKQLLVLIRDFAAEKSQGERRVVGLKMQIADLRAELDAASAQLEGAKRLKETNELELRGYEVELARNDASIQTLEARISQILDEINAVANDVEALKNEDRTSRDEFINQMIDFNSKIRKFQEKVASAIHHKNCIETFSGHKNMNGEDAQVNLKTLETELANIIRQTKIEEQEYEVAQNVHKQVNQELTDFEMKVSLMEAIMKETKEIQDLTRYPYQDYCGYY